MKLIAVPLDGSRNAEAALPRATQMATELGHRLLLFCVADSASVTAFRQLASSEDISVAHAAEMYLDQVCDQLPSEADVLTRVSSGNNPPSRDGRAVAGPRRRHDRYGSPRSIWHGQTACTISMPLRSRLGSRFHPAGEPPRIRSPRRSDRELFEMILQFQDG